MLLDFNPFCEMTDALLFTWEELQCGSVGGGEGEGPGDHSPELRVVECGSRIRPSDLAASRVPKVGHAPFEVWLGVAGGRGLHSFCIFFFCTHLFVVEGRC